MSENIYKFSKNNIKCVKDIYDILGMLKNEKTDYKIIFDNCTFLLKEDIEFKKYKFIKEIIFKNSVFLSIEDEKEFIYNTKIINLLFGPNTNISIIFTKNINVKKNVLCLKLHGLKKCNLFLNGSAYSSIFIEDSKINNFICVNYDYHKLESILTLKNVNINYLNLSEDTFDYLEMESSAINNMCLVNSVFPIMSLNGYTFSSIKEISIFRDEELKDFAPQDEGEDPNIDNLNKMYPFLHSTLYTNYSI